MVGAGFASASVEPVGEWQYPVPALDPNGDNQPTSIAAGPKGVVYVATGFGNIRRFSAGGKPRGMIRNRRMVIDLAVGPDGSVYALVDGGVRHYRANGRLISFWNGFTRKESRQYVVASGIAVSPDGAVYISGAGLANVLKLNARGKVQKVWGGRGREDGQFVYPSSIAAGPKGKVHVADDNLYRVQTFNANGRFRGAWGESGSMPGEAEVFSGVAAGPSGDVYLSDNSLGRIQAFDSNGAYREQWGGLGDGPGRFDELADVAAGPGGSVFTLELDGRVQRFTVDRLPAEPRPAISFASIGNASWVAAGKYKKYVLRVLNYGDAPATGVSVCPPDSGPLASRIEGGGVCRDVGVVPALASRNVTFRIKAPKTSGETVEFDFSVTSENADGGTTGEFLTVKP